MRALQAEEKETRSLDTLDLMHGYRVATLAVEIAVKLDMGMPEIYHLYTAGIFHDIGKSMIDRQILHKPGKLNTVERELVKKHVEYGIELGLQMKFHEDVMRFILSHHENYDGTGYPTGRKGETIPLGGRILKICDVYDALRMNRSYRPTFSKKQALRIMESEKKTFDPWIYKVFKGVVVGEGQ